MLVLLHPKVDGEEVCRLAYVVNEIFSFRKGGEDGDDDGDGGQLVDGWVEEHDDVD